MFYQGVVAFILLAQTVGLTVEQTGAELPNLPQCDSGYAVNVAPVSGLLSSWNTVPSA